MTESAGGRPVRFFALVMTAWVVIRLASPGEILWSEPMQERPVYAAHPKIRPASVRNDTLLNWRADTPLRHDFTVGQYRPLRLAVPSKAIRIIDTHLPTMPQATIAQPADRPAEVAPPINPNSALPLAGPQPATSRWHGSSWLLWREGSATRADAVAGGRLGGSQAGLRVDFDLTPNAASRATAYGRVSTALNRPASPEAALGLAWQPMRDISVTFAAERRIALGEGGRNANAVMAVGGFGPTPVAPSLEAEGYAQGGMVGFASRDFFVDGKISLLSPVRASPLRVGVSLSGGAQPQVERLDIGPEIQIRLPIKPVAARLGIEWRERVAGRAAPASGLAVTLGTYF